jgi:prepilin-type N-terminal cleavage/methylation domain-containing protein
VRKPPRYLGESGVTLLELLIALVLLGVVTAGVYGMVVSSANAARRTNAFLLAQAQVRAALDNILDETRWASSVDAAAPTSVTLKVLQNTPFSAASPYCVTFAYDAAQNTVTRTVTWQEWPRCSSAGSTEVLAYHVVYRAVDPGDPGNPCGGTRGLCFEYFDAAGNSLGPSPGSPANVARIRVVVSTTRDGATRTFVGDVALRAR